MKKISVMVLMFLLFSSFASASLFDWFRGDGLRDVTGEQVKSVAGAESYAGELKRMGNLNAEAKIEVTNANPLVSGSLKLSVVANSGTQATLKMEDVIEVNNGDIVGLGNDFYIVSVGANEVIDLKKMVVELRKSDSRESCPPPCIWTNYNDCRCVRSDLSSGKMPVKTGITAGKTSVVKTNPSLTSDSNVIVEEITVVPTSSTLGTSPGFFSKLTSLFR